MRWEGRSVSLFCLVGPGSVIYCLSSEINLFFSVVCCLSRVDGDPSFFSLWNSPESKYGNFIGKLFNMSLYSNSRRYPFALKVNVWSFSDLFTLYNFSCRSSLVLYWTNKTVYSTSQKCFRTTPPWPSTIVLEWQNNKYEYNGKDFTRRLDNWWCPLSKVSIITILYNLIYSNLFKVFINIWIVLNDTITHNVKRCFDTFSIL